LGIVTIFILLMTKVTITIMIVIGIIVSNTMFVISYSNNAYDVMKRIILTTLNFDSCSLLTLAIFWLFSYIFVQQLAHDDSKEDRRMTAAELLNSLAESLGADLCKQFIIPEVVSLAEDPVFRVRKATALNFHNICKIGGEHDLFERLMPAFVRLSKDDMYRVRRACADSLAEIAKYVSNDIRLGVLSEIYLRLTQDPSKLVKQSTLQQSGMFIASLPSKAVNDSILGNFCSMAMSPTGDASVDAELRRYCAFSFPAVLHTIGVSRWHEVRELYHALVQSRSINVKQTLACSLHEVARILRGPEVLSSSSSVVVGDEVNGTVTEGILLVEEELIPVFENLLQVSYLVMVLRCLI
jgi:hypothetical protein